MKRVATYAPFVLGVVIIAVAAVWQGNMSERWSPFPELDEFAARLKNVPLNFGEWRGVDTPGPPEDINRAAGNVGSISRSYHNAAGDEVEITVTCGRFRDVYAHTPDRCYPSEGFKREHEPVTREIKTSPQKSSFMVGTYLKDSATGKSRQRIFWSWNSEGPWVTPESRTIEFAGSHALYKLYAKRTIPDGDAGAHDAAIMEFIRAFVPEANKVLFPEPSAAPETGEKKTAKAS